jgi:segregation and condensation protein A
VRFELHLDVFEGPFDLLLGLIAKRQLDVTSLALSQVTDEFIAYIAAHEGEWDLGQATEFLVIAATLLDLKIAALLPGADVEDDEDLALLEARDLLFARVLQYRAYKVAAAHLQALEALQARRFGRVAELEPRYAGLVPELVLGISAARLAALAAEALTPKAPPVISISHIHAPRVSVAEHVGVLRTALQAAGSASFRQLVRDCGSTLEVVARFLGLLELYREGAVAFEQAEALGELMVRWAGPPEGAEPAAASGGPSDDQIDEEYG